MNDYKKDEIVYLQYAECLFIEYIDTISGRLAKIIDSNGDTQIVSPFLLKPIIHVQIIHSPFEFYKKKAEREKSID